MLSTIRMPQMGVADESAFLSKWLVREGDRVRRGQPVFSLETDKATFQYEAEQDGILVRILTGEGEEAAVGSPVGVLSDSGDFEGAELESLLCKLKKPDTGPQRRTEAETGIPQVNGAKPEFEHISVQSFPNERQKVSPRARKKADELGVNLANIRSGSGPEGRILERDVLNADQTNCAPVGFGQKSNGIYSGRPLMPADRIGTKQIEAGNAGKTGFVSRVIDAQKALASCTPQNRLTPGAMVCHELTQILVKTPELNARRHGDLIHEYGTVHLRLNVETASGTLRPVIRCAEVYTADELAVLMRNAAERCRFFTSKPQEFQEGTFSVTDLSAYGAESFTPELTPPELCALGIGTLTMQTRQTGQGGIKAYPTIRLTLAYDCAGVDAFRAAKFLNELALRLEPGGTYE